MALLIAMTVLGAGCGKQQSAQPWDGDWQRRIEVPAGVNGRCIDETLHIDRGFWRLTAVVHSTFRCNMPTLELQYEGVLGKVVVKRATPTLDAAIIVDTLKLARVANVSRGEFDYLSAGSVAQLAEVYLGNTEQTTMTISVAGDTLATPLFEPLWSVAYADTPYQEILKTYARVQPATGD